MTLARTSQNRAPKNQEAALRRLSAAVGDFIRYWGFRRIHGQIWTQVFLSARPLSGADLVRRLKVSKALVSSALGELEGYGLLRRQGGDGKTKTYVADPDVLAVIREILLTREARLIKKASDLFAELVILVPSSSAASEGARVPLDQDRIRRLGEMIDSASETLSLVVQLIARPRPLE